MILEDNFSEIQYRILLVFSALWADGWDRINHIFGFCLSNIIFIDIFFYMIWETGIIYFIQRIRSF